jgi:hypothetical protein
MRTENVKLIGRNDSEYFFVDSVFKHTSDFEGGANNFQGVTGCAVYPISEAYADDMLSDDMLEERYGDYWHECASDKIDSDCPVCKDGPVEEGCEDCGYESLSDLCAGIRQYDGYDAVFDYPGYEYEEILSDIADADDDADDVVFADCSSCGRIFSETHSNDFDEVYDRWALAACIEWEACSISYDCAVNVIFGQGKARFWGIVRVMLAKTVRSILSVFSK